MIVTLFFVALSVACTSRGVAPVYNRNDSPAYAQKKLKRPGYYRVKSGDTLYSIAWRYRLNYNSLAAWNRIKGPAYKIYPGQSLRLNPPSVTHKARSKVRPKTKTQAKVSKPPKTVALKAQPAVSQEKIKKTKKQQPANLKLNWRWPTKGRVVQSFVLNDPARKGVKIGGVSGQSIVAAESGKVVYSGGGLIGYGNLIIIKHNNKYLSAYGYNKKLLVKEGDKVLKGERIALMGSPRNGTGAVLHFEIRKQGKPINPLTLLKKK